MKKRPNRTPRNEKYSNLNKIKDWLIRSLSTVEELKRELVNWTAGFENYPEYHTVRQRASEREVKESSTKTEKSFNISQSYWDAT